MDVASPGRVSHPPESSKVTIEDKSTSVRAFLRDSVIVQNLRHCECGRDHESTLERCCSSCLKTRVNAVTDCSSHELSCPQSEENWRSESEAINTQTSCTDGWSILWQLGLTLEITAAAEQLLKAAESNSDERVRFILAEQGVKANLHEAAQKGGLNLVLKQEGLTKLLQYAKQSGNLHLMEIVLDDPQLGRGCPEVLFEGTKIVRFLLSSRFQDPAGGEVRTSPNHVVPQKTVHETRSLTTGVGGYPHTPTKDSEIEGDKPGLHKELQMYMNAINAILVGASVIASVTFSGFLQAPEDNKPFIQVFCIYCSMSFYSAVATVITGAGAALPSWHSPIPIEQEVLRVRMWVRVTSVLFAFSITSVLGAIPQPDFGNPPNLTRNRALMIVRCIALFACAAAMTAYVLRLNCKVVHNVVGLKSSESLPIEQAGGIRARMRIGLAGLSRSRMVGLVVMCALIYSVFLALLYFLPFYGKFHGE